MTILTKQAMNDINKSMLRLGAPMDIDNQGYNKFDYAFMYDLADARLSAKDMYQMACCLSKYTATQLPNYAQAIHETKAYYEQQVKTVNVVKTTDTAVYLSWAYDKAVSSYIRNDLDRSNYRWHKDADGNWELELAWGAVDCMLEQFDKAGYLHEDISAMKPRKVKSFDDKPAIVIEVIRPDRYTDLIGLKSDYHPKMVEAFHAIDGAWWSGSAKMWMIPIHQAATAYTALKNCGAKVSLKQLRPWADMVKSWAKPAPKLIDVDSLPLRFTPYDYQVEDAKRMLSSKQILNGNDMGCGKTFECVLVGESISQKKLVVCPPTLRLNWKQEIKHVNPKARVHIIYSADPFELVDGWNIIGYSSLDKFSEQLEAARLNVLFIDEAHYIQAINNFGQPDSKRAFTVMRLAATAEYVYPITGTPKTNRNKNLYNILKVINHPLVQGKSAFRTYGVQYCAGFSNSYGWNYDGNSNDAQLNRELQPYMIRHLKSEVLPDLQKQRIVMPVQVDLQEYHREIAEYLRQRKSREAEALAELMRARKALATRKVKSSIEFAQNFINQDKKVVIVTCFSEVVTAVERTFKDNCVKLVGGMTDQAKNQAIQQFQTGKPMVMVMNIIAGGVGVTLTAAHNMIINDFDWVPGNLIQAEDRICRSGQDHFCQIYYMNAIGAEMDEVLTSTLTTKFSTINNVVDGGTGDEIDFRQLIIDSIRNSR